MACFGALPHTATAAWVTIWHFDLNVDNNFYFRQKILKIYLMKEWSN